MAKFGDDLIQGLKEAIAFAEGRGDGVVHHPLDPRDVRKRAKLTQVEMAKIMGVSTSGYRKWEQGKRAMSGTAINLLTVLEKNPKAVVDALSG